MSKRRRDSDGLPASAGQDRRRGIHSRAALSLLIIAAVAMPTAACAQPSDADFARYVAADVKKDCMAGLAKAPSPAMRAHLEQLCICTEKKILATPMGRAHNDNDDTVHRKVQAASQACLNELGGAPGEKG